MSHEILVQRPKFTIYRVDLPGGVILVTFDDAVGEPKVTAILWEEAPMVGAMMLPPFELEMNKVAIVRDEVEKICRANSWQMVRNYANRRMGNYLKKLDPRVSWEPDTIQVGPNQKQMIVWDLTRSK